LGAVGVKFMPEDRRLDSVSGHDQPMPLGMGERSEKVPISS
jgi:hypothetical protein